jgi:hypothetical protein
MRRVSLFRSRAPVIVALGAASSLPAQPIAFCYGLRRPWHGDLRGANLVSGDRFGRRAFSVRNPQRLCVPALRATPTPTSRWTCAI